MEVYNGYYVVPGAPSIIKELIADCVSQFSARVRTESLSGEQGALSYKITSAIYPLSLRLKFSERQVEFEVFEMCPIINAPAGKAHLWFTDKEYKYYREADGNISLETTRVQHSVNGYGYLLRNESENLKLALKLILI